MRPLVVALTLATAAAALRLRNLGWGLPDVEEEALPVKKAFAMWGWDSGQVTLNPQTAGWPSLSFYVHLGLQHLDYLLGRAAGRYESKLDFFVEHADPESLMIPARLVSVVAATVTIFVIVRLAQRLTHWSGTILAGLTLALSPLFIEFSQKVTPDILLTLFVALALQRIVDVRERGRRRDYVWAAVWIALGTAAKYTPLLLVACLVVAHVMRLRHEGRANRLVDRRLLLAGLVGVAAFCVASPYTVLDIVVTKRDFAYQLTHLSSGHFGHQLQGPGYWFYLAQTLPAALGWPGLCAAVAGLGIAMGRRRGVWILLSLAFLVFYGVLGALKTRNTHYMLPALLPLSLGLAALVDEIRRTTTGRKTGVALAMLFAVVTIPLGIRTFDHMQRYARPSIESQAKQFILTQLDPQAVYARELGAPVLPRDPRLTWANRAVFRRLGPEQQNRLLDRPSVRSCDIPMYMVGANASDLYYDLRHYLDFDYIVLSASTRNRYTALPDLFPRQTAFYGDLERYALLVRNFEPTKATRGLGVWIYQVTPETRRVLDDRGPLAEGFHRKFLAQVNRVDLYSFLEFAGMLAASRGNWPRAELYISALLEVTPADTRQLQLLRAATYKQRVGKLAVAAALCNEYLRSQPHDAAAHYTLATIREAEGDAPAAVAAYQRALELAGSDANGQWYAEESRRRLDALTSESP